MDNNELIIYAENSGLESAKVQSLMARFGEYFSSARELVRGATDIVVKDENDFENMAEARRRRLLLQKTRTGAEGVRKQLKEDSLREGKAIDGMANIIKAIIEPVEHYLEGQEKFAENLAKAKKKEVEESRKNTLARFIDNIDIYNLHPDTMDSQTFDILVKNSEEAFIARKKAEQEAEEQRLLEQEKQKIENERIRAENEKLKQINIKKHQLALLGVMDSDILDSVSDLSDEEFSVLLEKSKIAYDNKIAQEKKAQEEKEKLLRELEESKKAEEDRIKKEQEELLKQAEIERQKELSPDKDKLIELLNSLKIITIPSLKDTKASEIGTSIKRDLDLLVNNYKSKVEGL